MAQPITIEVPGDRDAADLVQTLAARGLTAQAGRGEGLACAVIRFEREETTRLLVDVLAALESWAADRAVSPLVVRVGRVSGPGPPARRKVSNGAETGMETPDPLPTRRRSSR